MFVNEKMFGMILDDGGGLSACYIINLTKYIQPVGCMLNYKQEGCGFQIDIENHGFHTYPQRDYG